MSAIASRSRPPHVIAAYPNWIAPAAGVRACGRARVATPAPARPTTNPRREINDISCSFVDASPAMHRPVDGPVHRQIRALVRKPLRQRLVDIHTEPGRVARIHHASFKAVVMRKYAVGLFGVPH